MLKYFICICLCLWALCTYAQTLPELEAQLSQTQAQLSQLQTKLAKQNKQQQAVFTQARAATQALVQAQAYPVALWQAATLFRGGIGGAPLLAATAQAQATRLAKLQIQNSRLFQLYGQLQTQQAKLAAIATAIRQTESRMQRRQRVVLAEAGREASQLAVALTAALQAEPPLAMSAPEPLFNPVAQGNVPAAVAQQARVRPVTGQVVVGFRQGEGAEREGVVIAAPSGSVVKSPLTGRILFAEGFRQFGGLVIVEGADGHEEVLGGLGALNILAGQTVEAGQAVGELGPRGRLYWEVRVRGLARNPLANL
jgi:septal ring factor EnvC (AmiA/AmiB activator)